MSNLFDIPYRTRNRQVDRNFEAVREKLNKISLKQGASTEAPTEGYHEAYEIVYNFVPTAGGYIGWVSVESGTPGVWKEFGAISS